MMARSAYQNVPWLMVMLMLASAAATNRIRRIAQEVAVELNKRIASFEYEIYVGAELFVVGIAAGRCRVCLLLLMCRIGVA